MLILGGPSSEQIRRRRSLVSAQDWSASDNLGITNKRQITLKALGMSGSNPFRVETNQDAIKLRVVAVLQPWAEISERLRR